MAVGGQGSSHQSPRQGTEVGAAHLAGRGRQLSSARVASAVLATVIGVVGLHIQPTRLPSPPRGHRVGSPWSDSGDRHQPEGGTMDTSRRPDGPIDSRADRQLRQPQGLQLMKWILSWIQSRPLRWLPSPRAIIDTADASRSSGCTSAALRAGGSRDRRSRAAAPARLAAWCIRRAPPRGIQSRPIGGSVRCQTPSQVLPLPAQSRQYRRARTGRPVGPAAGGTDARQPATARHAPDPEASSPSMMSVSTGRSHRKDVVSEHGGEPVWHDFPEEAPRWLREEFSSDEDPDGHAHQGDPRGQTSTRPHR